MPTATLTSDKFPGISLFCPDAPDTLEHAPNSYMFHVSVPRTVTKATQAAIENQLYNFPPEVKNHVHVAFSVDLEEIPVAVEQEEEATDESTEKEEETIVLSDEDMDLIQVEISKLQGKPAAEVEPTLIATGGNEELPKALRIKYLQMVSEQSGLPKALKAVAKKMIEQI